MSINLPTFQFFNFFQLPYSPRRKFAIKDYLKGFPGGAVVGSPPADAGDTGSIPGPGRSHMLRSN